MVFHVQAESALSDALYESFEAELHGDVLLAVERALECGGESSTRCASRLAWLVQEHALEAFHAIPLPLQASGDATLSEHVFAGLTNVVGGTQRTRDLAVDYPAGVEGFGSASSWTVLGPVVERPVLNFGAADAMMGGERLPDRMELPSGPVLSHELWTSDFGYALIPNSASGVYVLESWLELSAGVEGAFLLQGRTQAEVWVDGELIAELAGVGEPGTVVPVTLSAGVHHIRMKVAHARAPVRTALLSAQAADAIVGWSNTPPSADGALGEARATGPPVRIATLLGADDPLLDWLLAAQSAILGSDLQQLHALANAAPDASALVSLWLARVQLARYDLPEQDARARALAALTDAEEQGAQTLIEHARLLITEDRMEDALELAHEAQAMGPNVLGVLMVLEELFDAFGWQLERRTALRAMRAQLPDNCWVAFEFVRLQLDRSNRVPDMPESWQRCTRLQVLVAERVTTPLGDFGALLEASRVLALANGGRIELARNWFQLAQVAQDTAQMDRATDWARQFLWDDSRVLPWGLEAIAAESDQLIEGVARIWEHSRPRANRLVGLSLLLGEDLLEPWRFDSDAVVQEYLAAEHQLTGDVVYVLDASTSVFEPDGEQFSIVHQIVELRTRDALDGFGEVGIPSEGTLLQARTIKRDGRVFVPEDVGASGALSMPNLEIGDFIELEWVEFPSGMSFERPIVRSPRFFFRTLDNPLFRTVSRYVYPPEWASEVVFDTRNFTGEPQTERAEGRMMTTFELRESAPAEPESLRPSAQEWMPSTQFAFGFSEEFQAQRYADRLAALRRVQPHHVATAIEQIGDARGDGVVRAAYRWMVDDVVDGGWFFAVPAGQTLLTGEGERLVALYALLHALEYDVDVVFISTFGEDETEGTIADITRFDLSALRVLVGGEYVWLEPDFDRYPYDYLRMEGQGRPAIIVSPERVGERLTTPVWDSAEDTARIEVEVEIEEDGSARVVVVERIPRRLASNMRSYLQTEEDIELVRRELGGSLAYSFGTVGDVEVEFDNLEAADVTLAMSYSFNVDGFAELVGDDLIWEGSIFERQLAGHYASSPSRTLPLMVDIPTRENVSIRLRAPRGYRAIEAPTASFAIFSGSMFLRESQVRGRSVHMGREIGVPIQRVDATDYDAFAAFLDALSSGSRQRVVWRR